MSVDGGYWTVEKVERLKVLWGEGRSAGQIAMLLGGTTRSAVIGKIHRIGLGGTRSIGRHRASTVMRHAAKREQTKLKPNGLVAGNVVERKAPPKAPVLPREPYTPPAPRVFDPAKMVSFDELEGHHCRFIIGDPKDGDVKFCGEEKAIGLSWCPECAKRVFASRDASQNPAGDPQRVAHWRYWGQGGVGKGQPENPAPGPSVKETEEV